MSVPSREVGMRERLCMSGHPGTVGVGELDRPALLLARVDLEEAAAVVAAGETILRAADRELPVSGAHERTPAPFSAAIVVHRVHIVEAGGERSFQQRLASSGTQVPPAFRRPPLRIPIPK